MYQSDLNHADKTLQEKLHTLYTLNRDKKIDLSFRPPYLRLLEKFGNPHLNLPPVIHVAGTNGKGSIIAMLRNIYEAAGYKVHTYTSPHLIHFNERIVLAGEEIRDDVLENLIDEALTLNDGGDLTFFEITTAMAFATFARSPADICLLEVGMGGRLDCTNVIDAPALTIISTIGMDHTEHLGDTIEKIATEKAGIIKEDIHCIVSPQNDQVALDTITQIANQKNAPITIANKPNKNFENALIGPHQDNNLSCVLEAVKALQSSLKVTEENIETGLRTVNWRARLQRLNAEGFKLPKTVEIYLDGGHNQAAGKSLAQQAELWAEDNKPLHIILGMMQGKDTKEFIEPLEEFANAIYVTNIENEPKSQSDRDLKLHIPSAIQTENFKDALSLSHKNAPNARILICGSLYLAGQVLQHTTK